MMIIKQIDCYVIVFFLDILWINEEKSQLYLKRGSKEWHNIIRYYATKNTESLFFFESALYAINQKTIEAFIGEEDVRDENESFFSWINYIY